MGLAAAVAVIIGLFGISLLGPLHVRAGDLEVSVGRAGWVQHLNQVYPGEGFRRYGHWPEPTIRYYRKGGWVYVFFCRPGMAR
jgi:hypothetical protein